MIEVELPDGHVLEFPDETPPELIQQTAARYARTAKLNQQFEQDMEAEQERLDASRTGVDKAADLAREVVQGATLGFGDEIVAGATAAMLPGDYGPNYDRVLSDERRARQNFKRLNPTLAPAAEFAGAVLSPVNAAIPMAAAGASLPARVGIGALTGGTSGAAYGYGIGEGEADRALSAAEGGAMGLAAGAALPLIAAPFTRGARTESVKEFAKRAPSIDDLRSEAQALYANTKGAAIPADNVRRGAMNAYRQAIDSGMDYGPRATNNPGVRRTVERLAETAADAGDNPIPFGQLDQIRKAAQGQAGRVTEPHDAMLGAQLVEAIDDIVEQADPALGEALAKARNLWGRMRRSEIIANAMAKAENQASGYENGLRTQFRTILNNKKLRRGFSADEIKAMEDVVRGTRLGNLLRQAGRLGMNVFGRNFNNTLTPVAAAGLLSPAVPMAGSVAGRLAEGATARNAELVRAMVASGQGPAQVAPGRLSRLLQAPANMATDLLPLGLQPVNPLRDTLPRPQR